MSRPIPTAALASLLLAGCSLIPDYQRPALPVAEAFPGETPVANGGDHAPAADQIGWREFFTDARLQRLIDVALRNNRDLRVAILNVEASQAQFRGQRADLFPQISVTGTQEVEGLPNSTTIPSSGSYQATGSSGGVYRYYTAGIGFTSYELDLFGRVRSLTSEAFEQYLSSAETRRATQLSLVGQVATAYFTWLADRDLLDLTRQTLESQTASYDLTKAEFDQDTATALTLRQAESVVDTARANLAQYTRQVAQDENALVLVLGQPMPADLPAARGIADQGLVADLPAGLPSDLLSRRPDVVAAEHTLLAANANIGAARAAFFPSISLTASDGVASNKLSSLFTAGATTWSFAPTITIPIFTAGQNEANLDVAKTDEAIDVARYEQTIQTAFREVSDALVARGTYQDQLSAQQALVAADADAYRLSDLRFRAGIDNFLTTLDSERSLYAARQTLVSLEQARLANLVTLYKALGGGWSEHTGDPTAPS